MDPTVCPIDFAISDDSRSICRLVEHLSPLFAEASRKSEIHIDLTKVQYLGPFAAAVLVATRFRAIERDIKFDCTFPDHRPSVLAFARAAGLHNILGPVPQCEFSAAATVTVPINIVKEVTYDSSDPLLGIVRRHGRMSANDEDHLKSAVNEVIQNVEDHAQSGLGAAFCAKYLERSKKVSVAIVDCGLGIFTTLSKRYPEISNAEMALMQVVAGGFSAKSKANNFGVGISNLWSQITGPLKGDIFIISENSIVYCDKLKRPKSRTLKRSFAGTGVFFTVPIPDITTQKG